MAVPAWLKYTGIGCGILVVVAMAFGAAVFFTVGRLTAEPEKVAEGFLAAMAAGDHERAHGAFSAPLKDAQPLAELVATAEANPSLFDVVDTTFSSRSIDAATGAKLEGNATLRAGTRVPISFHLVKENDSWKILAYHFGTEP